MAELSKKYELLASSNLNKCRSVIRTLLARDQINPSELARKIQLPQPTIHRLLTGKTEDPKLSTLTLIAESFSVSIDQLLGNVPLTCSNNSKRSSLAVPIISWADATDINIVLPRLTTNNWKKWLTIDVEVSSSSFGLISKRSMEPQFPTGSILVIDSKTSPTDGDLVIVHYRKTTEATIRELILDGPIQELHSILNSSVSDKLTDAIKLIGVIVQTRFSYKQEKST